MATVHFFLGCLLGVHILSTEANTEDNTILPEEERYSLAPVVLLGAIQACVSVAAFMAISQSPAPDPSRIAVSVTPLRYSVHLANDAENRNFWGRVQILVHASLPVETIALHAKDLLFDKSSLSIVEETTAQTARIKSVNYEPQNEWYLLELEAPLLGDRNYTISVSYKSSRLKVNSVGLECIEITSGNITRWLQFSRFEPSGARTVFPCFDEPSMKARFTVSIATPPGMHALSNMPLKDTSEPVKELPGWVWSRFEESVPMSTYLVAFAVTDFVQVKSEGGRNFSTWVTAGQEEQVRLIAKAIPHIVSAMEEITGIPYSLPKLDNVVIPETHFASFSGLENWGLIVYDSNAVLAEIDKSTMEEIRSTLSLVAHEIAHMWFGNLVTPAWWDHLWLKEGFADYFSNLVLMKLYPDQHQEEHFVLNTVHLMLMSEFGEDTMHKAAVSLGDIEEKYSMQAYTKGSVMARMMEHILTPPAFRTGIHQYLLKYAYKSAAATDLFEALSAAENGTLPAGVGMAEVMDSWVSRGGYPLLTVTRDYDKGEATVCQEVFRSVRASNSSSWWVPLSYTTQTETDFSNTAPRLWLPGNQSCVNISGLPGKDQWVIFNVQQTGYYRVNYDLHNWLLLTNFLNSEQYEEIHVLNRAQLLDDAFSIMKYGLLDVALVRNLSHYVHKETSPTPWLTLLRKRLMCSLFGQDSGYLEAAVELVEEMTSKPEHRGASHVWYSVLDAVCTKNCAPSACLENMYEQFLAFKEDPLANRIKPEKRRQVLCGALDDDRATEEDLLFVWNLGLNSTLTSERDDITSAVLECPSNTRLQHRSLALLNSGTNKWINPRDMHYLIRSLCSRNESVYGVEQLLAMIETEYPSLDVLRTLTSIIAEQSGPDGQMGKMWCLMVSKWINGVLRVQ